jgi:hypothetical protein
MGTPNGEYFNIEILGYNKAMHVNKGYLLILFLVILLLFTGLNRHRIFNSKGEIGRVERAYYRSVETPKDLFSIYRLNIWSIKIEDDWALGSIGGPINKITGEYIGGGPGIIVCKKINNNWTCPITPEVDIRNIKEVPETLLPNKTKEIFI